MIIIKLQGGLGNQLFQYALGRTLEKRYKKDVKYDLSFYANNKEFTARSYLLDKFDTAVKIASHEEINKTKYPFGLFSKIIYLINKALNKFIFKKYHISYEPEFLELIKNKDFVYLEGYWQSICYVAPCLEDLKKELVLKDDKLSGILNGESVAIHIRRGDYLKMGGGLDVLDISYYKKSAAFISEKLKDVRYYIFTDDVAWVKENFNFLGKGDTTYISDLGFHDYEEILLMAQCKNIIIANSSFSWWGAMLNQNKDAIIVCPKDWKNIFLKNDENLCPKEWVRI